MTHNEKLKELQNEFGKEDSKTGKKKVGWKLLEEHGVKRCCASLTNRKTGKNSQCRKAINWELGKESDFYNENSSYCENHAKLMEAINSKYSMTKYE